MQVQEVRMDEVDGVVRQLNAGIWASLDEVWEKRPHLTRDERNLITLRAPEEYLESAPR